MSDLAQKIEDRTAVISVTGLGYVGLPLVERFMDAGFTVVGVDSDVDKLKKLRNRESYIASIPDSKVREWYESERFMAVQRPYNIASVYIVCVPTPLTNVREPELKHVVSAFEEISEVACNESLFVLESTTYPTTTRGVVKPILDAEIGFYHLAYSPEREDPGNPEHTIGLTPKVVGGIDEASLELASKLYETIVPQVVRVSSCEIAEACKILENTYRAVNIALVNEMKMLYDEMGIDIWEVIEAAKTKPFGFQAFYPGPGLGGHCLPCDPFYLTWLAKTQGVETKFIELAGEVNRQMPHYVVSRTMEFMNEIGKTVKDSRILVVGLSYKKNVADPRESPSFKVIELLLKLGADVRYHDPLIPDMPPMRDYDFSEHPELAHSVDVNDWTMKQYDATVMITDHSCLDYKVIFKRSPLIVDTRGVTSGVKFSSLKNC